MKRYSIATLFITALLSCSTVSYAQYDDVYYNPGHSGRNSGVAQQNSSYDDDDQNSYGDYDEEVYDYYYTSRIRRFHRPVLGFSYFDPFYTDLYYYDPFLSPGITVLIYDSPWSYSHWAYWNRWAYYRPYYYGYNPWAYYDPFYYGYGGPAGLSFHVSFTFGSPWWGWGGGYPSPYYYGGYSGYSGGFYCPPTWGGGYNYYTANNYYNYANDRGVTSSYGPRVQTGLTTAPRTNVPRSDAGRRAPVGNTVSPRSTDAASPADDGNIRPRISGDRYSRPAPQVYQPTYERNNREVTDRPQAVTPRSPAYTPARTSPDRPDEQRATPSRTYSPAQAETRPIERSTPNNNNRYTPRQPANPAPRYTPNPQRSGSNNSYNRPAPSQNEMPARSGNNSMNRPAPSRNEMPARSGNSSINRPSPSPGAAPSRSGGNSPSRATPQRSSGKSSGGSH